MNRLIAEFLVDILGLYILIEVWDYHPTNCVRFVVGYAVFRTIGLVADKISDDKA